MAGDENQNNRRAGNGGARKPKIKINAKNMSGVITIERNMHDDAVVISGSLSLENVTSDINTLIAEELEAVALEINKREGIIGHIKAAVTATATDMISVTDEKAMVKTSPFRGVRITLTVIVFLLEPEIAEDLARKALAAIRAKARLGG